MRYFIPVFLIFCFGCKKTATEEGNGAQLQLIKWNAKVQQRFTYNNNGRLLKEDVFGGCETNPADEFTYIYNGNALDSIRLVMRSLYSSTAAICDPASGIQSAAAIRHNAQGRIQTIVRGNGASTLFQYNAQGFIEKAVTRLSGNSQTYTYQRDTRGNIVEATDGQGHVTRYEYDDKINPYYLMKLRPDIITAYYNSPNNVVKSIAANNQTETRYEYNSRGLPVKMIENGSTYEFVYR